VLLDENVPVQLKAMFLGHVIKSVNDRDVGWNNIKNGRLLTAMEGWFDLLVTADRNMFAQQNLTGRQISILVLPTNRRNDVLGLGQKIFEVAIAMTPATYGILEKDGTLRVRSFVRPDSDGGTQPAGETF
jgi:hypothetical protein